jgi:hypothetical protein
VRHSDQLQQPPLSAVPAHPRPADVYVDTQNRPLCRLRRRPGRRPAGRTRRPGRSAPPPAYGPWGSLRSASPSRASSIPAALSTVALLTACICIAPFVCYQYMQAEGKSCVDAVGKGLYNESGHRHQRWFFKLYNKKGPSAPSGRELSAKQTATAAKLPSPFRGGRMPYQQKLSVRIEG